MLTSIASKLAAAAVTTILFATAGEAFAAADLQVSLQGPASPLVYAASTYTATVKNLGNQNAAAVTVQVELPLTGTSPQIYILGELSGVDPRCQVVNRMLRCALGEIRKTRSASFTFGFKLPQAAKTLSFKATAATTSSENSLANNVATLTPAIAHPSQPIVSDLAVTNSHCTGSATLTAYFECLTAPSSISEHASVFHLDGSISIPDAPEYTGSWQLSDASRHLVFEYLENDTVVASFSGWSVGQGCYEGVVNFVPASSYVSIYRVCPE